MLRGLRYNRLLPRPITSPDERFLESDLRLTLRDRSGEVLDIISFKRSDGGGVTAASLNLRSAGWITPVMLGELFHVFSLIGETPPSD